MHWKNRALGLSMGLVLTSACASDPETPDVEVDGLREPLLNVQPAKLADVQRTVLFIFGETEPGQDMFIRGGLDHQAARDLLGYDCARSPHLCSLPIAHRHDRNETTRGWKMGDSYLDWLGAELTQGSQPDGTRPEGSPLDWTTDRWPSAWGEEKTVDVDGFGRDSINTFGMHYWKLDVDMDCSRAVADADGNRWFEVKSFISNGPGWEGDVQQPGTPYASNNHFAQCGKVNVFRRGDSSAQIFDFPRFAADAVIRCAEGELRLEPSGAEYVATIRSADAVAFFTERARETFEHEYWLYGEYRTATITKALPWQARVADDSQTMTVVDFRRSADGSFITSGPPGTGLDWNGDALTLTIRGSNMPNSKTIAYYEVGAYTFEGCQAL